MIAPGTGRRAWRPPCEPVASIAVIWSAIEGGAGVENPDSHHTRPMATIAASIPAAGTTRRTSRGSGAWRSRSSLGRVSAGAGATSRPLLPSASPRPSAAAKSTPGYSRPGLGELPGAHGGRDLEDPSARRERPRRLAANPAGGQQHVPFIGANSGDHGRRRGWSAPWYRSQVRLGSARRAERLKLVERARVEDLRVAPEVVQPDDPLAAAEVERRIEAQQLGERLRPARGDDLRLAQGAAGRLQGRARLARPRRPGHEHDRAGDQRGPEVLVDVARHVGDVGVDVAARRERPEPHAIEVAQRSWDQIDQQPVQSRGRVVLAPAHALALSGQAGQEDRRDHQPVDDGPRIERADRLLEDLKDGDGERP